MKNKVIILGVLIPIIVVGLVFFKKLDRRDENTSKKADIGVSEKVIISENQSAGNELVKEQVKSDEATKQLAIIPQTTQANEETSLLKLPLQRTDMIDNSILDSLATSSTKEERSEAINNLLNMGEKAIPILVEGLKSKDLIAQMSCIMALGELRNIKAEGPLLVMLASEAKAIVITSITALGKVGSKNSIDELKKILDNGTDKDLVHASLIALGEINDPSVYDSIERWKDSEDLYTQSVANLTVAKMGDKKATVRAKSIIEQSEHIGAIEASILALGYVGGQSDYEYLKEMLNSGNVAKTSWRLIRTLKLSCAMLEMKYGGLSDQEQSKFLSELLKEEDTEIRKFALGGLAKIDLPEANETILMVANNANDPLQYFAKMYTYENKGKE